MRHKHNWPYNYIQAGGIHDLIQFVSTNRMMLLLFLNRSIRPRLSSVQSVKNEVRVDTTNKNGKKSLFIDSYHI